MSKIISRAYFNYLYFVHDWIVIIFLGHPMLATIFRPDASSMGAIQLPIIDALAKELAVINDPGHDEEIPEQHHSLGFSSLISYRSSQAMRDSQSYYSKSRQFTLDLIERLTTASYQINTKQDQTLISPALIYELIEDNKDRPYYDYNFFLNREYTKSRSSKSSTKFYRTLGNIIDLGIENNSITSLDEIISSFQNYHFKEPSDGKTFAYNYAKNIRSAIDAGLIKDKKSYQKALQYYDSIPDIHPYDAKLIRQTLKSKASLYGYDSAPNLNDLVLREIDYEPMFIETLLEQTLDVKTTKNDILNFLDKNKSELVRSFIKAAMKTKDLNILKGEKIFRDKTVKALIQASFKHKGRMDSRSIEGFFVSTFHSLLGRFNFADLYPGPISRIANKLAKVHKFSPSEWVSFHITAYSLGYTPKLRKLSHYGMDSILDTINSEPYISKDTINELVKQMKSIKKKAPDRFLEFVENLQPRFFDSLELKDIISNFCEEDVDDTTLFKTVLSFLKNGKHGLFDFKFLNTLKKLAERNNLPISSLVSLEQLRTKSKYSLEANDILLGLSKKLLREIYQSHQDRCSKEDLYNFISFLSPGILKLGFISTRFADSVVKELVQNSQSLKEIGRFFASVNKLSVVQLDKIKDVLRSDRTIKDGESFLAAVAGSGLFSDPAESKSAVGKFVDELGNVIGMPLGLIHSLASQNFKEALNPNDIAYMKKILVNLPNLNSDARSDQRVDLDRYREVFSSNYPKLLAVSAKAAKNLIDADVKQRNNLPLSMDKLNILESLNPSDIGVLREIHELNPKAFNDQPSMIIDLASYIKTFKAFNLEIAGADNPNSFESIAKANFNDPKEINNLLGTTIAKNISKNLGIEIDIENSKNLQNLARDWDMRYFGTLLSNHAHWSYEDKSTFGLLFKSYIEGTSDGILYPPAYSKYPLSLYGNSYNQNKIQRLRRHNLVTLMEMEKLGIDVNAWVNASSSEILRPSFTAGDAEVKPVKVLRKNLEDSFKNFSTWFNEKWIKEGNRSIGPKKFRAYKEAINPWLSKKTSESKLFRKEKQKELVSKTEVFLEKIKAFYEEGQLELPEALLDLDNAVAAINRYDPDNPVADNYRIRVLDKRDLGHYMFIGNRAGSCSSFSQYNNRVVPLLLDIGTQYIAIEDHLTTDENPKGEAKGYTRIFGAIDNRDQSIIAQDTIDGVLAYANQEKISDYVSNFAQLTSTKGSDTQEKGRIGVNLRSGKVRSKIGGVPQGYFQHFSKIGPTVSSIGSQVLPSDQEELEKIDNWQPKGGWQEIAA